MKKYVLGLVILIVQNACAMETFILNGISETDEKCKLVAKYLYKYPLGRDSEEARKIEEFFDVSTPRSDIDLPWCVTKYKNVLATIEGQSYLTAIYTSQLPLEIRKKVFGQALFYVAKEYYVRSNTLQFLKINSWDGLHRTRAVYVPYFRAEINEENICMQWGKACKNALLHGILGGSLWIDDGVSAQSYECSLTPECVEKVTVFLDKKNERVNSFKLMFNNYIEVLSKYQEQEAGIAAFTNVLQLYTDLIRNMMLLNK